MPRRPTLWMVGITVLVLAVIAGAAAVTETRLAFTLGVSPDDEVVTLSGRRVACQEPIDVPAAFESVRFRVAREEGEPAPAVGVRVRSFPDGRPLGSGRLEGGYADRSFPEVRVGRVPEGARASVCLSALGSGKVDLYGGPAAAARTSSVRLGATELRRDLTLVFLRERPRSLLSLVPDMLDRASLWRPAPVSGGLIAVLLVAVALGAPVLLGRALSAAAESGDPGPGGPPAA